MKFNLKKLSTFALLATIPFLTTACYEQVPAGHVGKIMGKNGWQPEVYPPSKVYVDSTFTFTPEKLFVVETTTKKYQEPITVLLADKLELSAEVVFRGRINDTTTDRINMIFNDMHMNDNVVTTDEVYEVYGKMIILNTAREVISKYNVDEVNTNYARITSELYLALEPKLAGLPIEISDVTIGNIRYPEIVTKAIEQAKERRMAIEKEQAQVQIELEKAKGREEVAKAEYRIKMLEGKRLRDYNQMIAQGITKDLLELRRLELREMELNKWDGVLPSTLMNGEVPVILSK